MNSKDQPQTDLHGEPGCGRQGDLVAYLYDEATAAERSSFERHLSECAACSEELSSFRRVRDDLGAWEVGFAPRTEIAVARRPLEVLRELVGLFPQWVRVVGAMAAAAVVVLLALAMTRTSIDTREGTISFGFSKTQTQTQTQTQIQIQTQTAAVGQQTEGGAYQSTRTDSLTRAEIERIIEGRLTEARAADAQRVEELRIQLASLKARLAASDQSQAQLRAQMGSLRTEQRALLARGQSTLGEWLFAVNGSREAWGAGGAENEKEN